MLKTKRGSRTWLITQPAHAELAGAMAAHWGNHEFTRPGHYAPSTDGERLRVEVTLAVAEHDNGWWEWEADPPLSAQDGLPQGLDEVVEDATSGMDRWRLGIRRLIDPHPYASLLIGDHAYWLYAARFEPNAGPEFTHHLQRGRSLEPRNTERETRAFLAEIRDLQEWLRRRLEKDSQWSAALQPEIRRPHARLLQTLDALSLAMCSAIVRPEHGEPQGLGADPVVFDNVPRRSWEDRVTLEITPLTDGRILLSPYPFDRNPLNLSVPARVVEPGTWWRQAPLTLREYEFLPG
jgi:hypothetical protein